MIPKRTFWTSVGYGAGLASSVYVQRRVRKVVRRVAPAEVRQVAATRSSAIAGKARNAGDNVVGALREGRAAMRATERDLRDEFGRPGSRRAG